MEKQLFDWGEFDIVADCMLQFYDCTLKVDVGRFLVGDKISEITIDFENGLMELYENSEIQSTHNLVLTLKE